MDGHAAVNLTDVDKLLVDELNEISNDEREQLMEKVHGISGIENGIDEALVALQQELDVHYQNMCEGGSNHDGKESIEPSSPRNWLFSNCSSTSDSSCSFDAYREARSKNSLMLSERDFQRGFLEAENLDPGRAAVRLMKYLELLRRVFDTSDVLFRPIFIDDLTIEAKEELAKGSQQILSDRDSSGRRVFVYLRDINHSEVSWRHRTQVYLYFAQKMFEDSRGMVSVTFLHLSTLFTGNRSGWNQLERAKTLIEAMPRFDAIHLCLPNCHALSNIVKSALLVVMGKENRYCTRIHEGSHVECRYSLATYGIPVNRLPLVLDFNTTLRKDNVSCHKKWIRMLKEKEAMIKKIHVQHCQEVASSSEKSWGLDQNSTFELLSCDDDDRTGMISFKDTEVIGMTAVKIFRQRFVECPCHEDCLFGRGRNTMKHPGNIAMRSLLDQRIDQYVTASHNNKSEIAWDVVKEIKAGGGRFLRELESGFFEHVDDKTARKKISLAFRDAKSRTVKPSQRLQPKRKQHLDEKEIGRRKRKSE